ncbi:MAG: DUF1987 domain-containing protein [Proteobacteria bacterium]|nr:DUF1987 domain-containing protein [Pseudomonadota bacterium]
MSTLHIPATERTPELLFDFAANTFSLKGESYPENIAEFFGEPVGKLKEHLGAQAGQRIAFHFALPYFNSSSAKTIMGLFSLLDQAAEDGNDVLITWTCEEGDDMQEMGEEFAEDLDAAKFELKFLE